MLSILRCLRQVTAVGVLTGMQGPVLGQDDLSAPGTLDLLDAAVSGLSPAVYACVPQADGKVILGGYFTQLLLAGRTSLARMNADGTVDASFIAHVGGGVNCVAVQADGKILIGGGLGVARLNPDGTADENFHAGLSDSGVVMQIAFQPDGKIVLAGVFQLTQTVSGTPVTRSHVARLHADGTLDVGFDVRPNGEVYAALVQEDGKVVLGGSFRSVSPQGGPAVTRNRLVRLHADGTLDAAFDPNASAPVHGLAQQADGKLLAAGSFTSLSPNGSAAVLRNGLVRLHDNGEVDASWDPAPFLPGPGPTDCPFVRSMSLQADGKLLVGGAFTGFRPNGGQAIARSKLARLHPDGTVDAAFDARADYYVESVSQQADGRLLAGGLFYTMQSTGWSKAANRRFLARLYNGPGNEHLQVDGGTRVTWVRTGSVPDVTGVTFDLSTDGGGTWVPLGRGTRVAGTGTWECAGLNLPAAGMLRCQGRTRGGYRCGSSGWVRQTAAFPGARVSVEQPEGIALTAGTDVNFGTVETGGHCTLNFVLRNDGVAGLTGLTAGWAGTDSREFSIIAEGMAGTLAPGERTHLAVRFRPQAAGPAGGMLTISAAGTVSQIHLTGTGVLPVPGMADSLLAGIVGQARGVRTAAVQPDGKIIIAGDFHSIHGVPRNFVARLNRDGTLDMEFDPFPNGEVFAVAVQEDGKVLLGGRFTSLQPNDDGEPTSRQNFARVHASGSLDREFDTGTDAGVSCLFIQQDGRILLGGAFVTVMPAGGGPAVSCGKIARLLENGTVDPEFLLRGGGYSMSALSLQEDGKILLAGNFDSLEVEGEAQLIPRRYVARVHADGSVDAEFNPWPSSFVFGIAQLVGGRVILGGEFTSLRPGGTGMSYTRRRLARLQPGGTLDMGFIQGTNGGTAELAVQADGKVLVGGTFTEVGPPPPAPQLSRGWLIRLDSGGGLDLDFDIGSPGTIQALAVQQDGRILVAGGFWKWRPGGKAAVEQERRYFARVINDRAIETLTVPDAGQVLWERRGSGPEVVYVRFDLSTDGGSTWTPLGPGQRVGATAHWRLSGLTLPDRGKIRARGRVMAGNDSAGLIEKVAAFPPTAQELWRLAHFGITENEGPAADDADGDHDGLVNLLEWVCRLDPLTANESPLTLTLADGVMVCTFPRSSAARAAGAGLVMEWSGSLLPGSWSSTEVTSQVIGGDGQTEMVQAAVPPGNGARRFVRLRARTPP